MKKIGDYIKTHKKRVIVIAVIIILLPLIGLVVRGGLRLGFIPVPKHVMLWHFNNNREDFDYIAKYIEEHPETDLGWVISGYEEEIMVIEDEKLRDSISKALKPGLFSSMFYDSSADKSYIEIKFYFSYNSHKKGDGTAIIYSTKYLDSNEIYVDWYAEDEAYGYEHIDGNWYYEYREW